MYCSAAWTRERVPAWMRPYRKDASDDAADAAPCTLVRATRRAASYTTALKHCSLRARVTLLAARELQRAAPQSWSHRRSEQPVAARLQRRSLRRHEQRGLMYHHYRHLRPVALLAGSVLLLHEPTTRAMITTTTTTTRTMRRACLLAVVLAAGANSILLGARAYVHLVSNSACGATNNRTLPHGPTRLRTESPTRTAPSTHE